MKKAFLPPPPLFNALVLKRPEESLKITTKQRRRLCRFVGVVGAICHTTNKILL